MAPFPAAALDEPRLASRRLDRLSILFGLIGPSSSSPLSPRLPQHKTWLLRRYIQFVSRTSRRRRWTLCSGPLAVGRGRSPHERGPPVPKAETLAARAEDTKGAKGDKAQCCARSGTTPTSKPHWCGGIWPPVLDNILALDMVRKRGVLGPLIQSACRVGGESGEPIPPDSIRVVEGGGPWSRAASSSRALFPSPSRSVPREAQWLFGPPRCRRRGGERPFLVSSVSEETAPRSRATAVGRPPSDSEFIS